MSVIDDPFAAADAHEVLADVGPIADRRDVRAGTAPFPAPPAVGRLCGFDVLDQPLIDHVAQCPGEVLTGRTTVPLRQSMIGREVVLLFEAADVRAPIVMGVLRSASDETAAQERDLTIDVDSGRYVIEAEREIVLRCGDASITLTRAGKVLIKGSYIVSRSTGYNKIKGAAVDIN